MAKYRDHLPQLQESTFLTDGGLETTLIFHEGIALPFFAAFPLLLTPEGKQILQKYYRRYLTIAQHYHTGFVLETPTWRASLDWGQKMGYSTGQLENINRLAVTELELLRQELEQSDLSIVISGCLGPRGDGYAISTKMTALEAQEYHLPQIKTFSQTNADVVSAFTLNYTEEATGIINAAKACNMPVVISYTVETDGNLPSGEPLKYAIQEVDKLTDQYPVYYMINCAHPDHFKNKFTAPEAWVSRIKGIRANASAKSHAELDEAEQLDIGDKQELANGYQLLKYLLPQLTVIGGCCGTDHTHLEKICQTWFQAS
ncbi:homocysteine S-methyltransferase family protein [Adhaeribacter pallidiroseus]|uniref:Homocysteine S-methyltransferase n=1 Tax=Adhaeribacter pallidiroseus TaxID=2072847 RepID=A0A369QF30_9BACT|nr:homocysteine S-methyltransferase family protein [Adhaeribacter pallidiroseus]RDC62175.1 Homocysteine S-methyltransferase [Adhaeribacter pallidiroseus]